jgi:acetoin utilization protein AcuB
MIAIDLITDEIPPIKPQETGLKALKWMDEFKISHLPIVNNTEYVGLISDEDILDLNQPEEPISGQINSILRPFVMEDQHIYEVMKLISALNLTVVPVLNKEEQYIGSTTLSHIMKLITNIASINDAGGVIVLEVNENDYSMAEIAQIVEGNDAKILSSYITSASDSTKMEVTLKINKKDLNGILQTFYRYDYTVSASFQESRFQDDLKGRYDSLMNYLNL